MIRTKIKTLYASIGARIVIPYFALTLLVAAIGTFIVTSLVTSSVQERVENQLLDAGRIVAENVVENEDARLKVLRTVATTDNVPEALVAGDDDFLAQQVSAIAFNERASAVSVVDTEGIEVFGWQRFPDQATAQTTTNTDFSRYADVEQVLQNETDDFSDRRIFIAANDDDLMLFTVGPVILNDEIVGAVLVGTTLDQLVTALSEESLTRVTLYDTTGVVLATSLGGDLTETAELLQGSPEQYAIVQERLRLSSDQHDIVIASEDEVLLRNIEALNQKYIIAYGDWRLRNQSFGLFTVALPSDFITRLGTTSGTTLSLMFFAAAVAVLVIGFHIARRITNPLRRLVDISTAVAQGDLEQRTNIKRKDEIGALATAFDIMTGRLAERNRQLIEQAIELEAILNSIADAVIVFNNDNQIMATNPAADKILSHLTYNNDTPATYLQSSRNHIQSDLKVDTLMALDTSDLETPRFRMGGRVFGVSASPFKVPGGDELGRVIVLRDVTRQAEAEQLKDGFITSISHELRTPLTSMKGYIHLLNSRDTSNLTEQQTKFLEIIRNSTELLVKHVNKLIDITSIQEDSLSLRKRRESFTEIVNEVVQEWQGEMAQKELSFRINIDDAPLWVMADRMRLEWAIDNVLRNAHHYTLSSGEVTVRLSSEGDQARLTVRDTGVGISTVDQPYIFSRFYRAQNELTLNVPGLGIELFIAKSIIDAHNGRIWVESEAGKGSLFGIELPLVE